MRRIFHRRFRLPVRFNRNAAVRRVRNRRCLRALLAHCDCIRRHRRFIRDADVRPAVRLPRHRLQVRHTPVQPTTLEVQEPMLPLRRLDPRALMRAVRLAAALFEYDLGLIWAENTPAAQAHLPPRRDAARGRKDVVPSVLQSSDASSCRRRASGRRRAPFCRRAKSGKSPANS